MKNKKTIAFAMAAVSVAGTVVPTFAAEASVIVKDTVDVKLAEGKSVKNDYKYDQVYDTKFTIDKKDDTLKEGIEILQVITKVSEDRNDDGNYLVAVDMTENELNQKKQAIDEENKKLDKIKKDINAKLKIKSNGKKVYKIKKELVKADKGSSNNALIVTLESNNSDYKSIAYKFEGVVIESEEVPSEVKPVIVDLDLNKGPGYKTLSKIIFDLEKSGNKYIVSKKEVNSTTLELNIYTNDENKHNVANIKISNFDKFNSKELIRIPGNSDFAGHWAEDTIFNAMYDGIVDITNNFRTNDGITRAEFVKIVNKTFGYTKKVNKEYFVDVEQGQWFYDDILIAIKAGYINGYEDGTFRPNEKISRQEAAVILATIANNGKTVETKLTQGTGEKIDKDIVTDYKDDKDIAAWADESVQSLKNKNIIKGYEDGTFRPKNDITRAEALTMIKGPRK